MTYKFASEEWVQAWVAAINASPAYRKSAANWEGDFYFIVEPGPGETETETMYVDLWHGEARMGMLVSDPSQRSPEFTIRAPMAVWRRVVEKKLDPIQGMVTGQLKLKGTLTKIMRYAKAANDLVVCATKVPTEF